MVHITLHGMIGGLLKHFPKALTRSMSLVFSTKKKHECHYWGGWFIYFFPPTLQSSSPLESRRRNSFLYRACFSSVSPGHSCLRPHLILLFQARWFSHRRRCRHACCRSQSSFGLRAGQEQRKRNAVNGGRFFASLFCLSFMLDNRLLLLLSPNWHHLNGFLHVSAKLSTVFG